MSRHKKLCFMIVLNEGTSRFGEIPETTIVVCHPRLFVFTSQLDGVLCSSRDFSNFMRFHSSFLRFFWMHHFPSRRDPFEAQSRVIEVFSCFMGLHRFNQQDSYEFISVSASKVQFPDSMRTRWAVKLFFFAFSLFHH